MKTDAQLQQDVMAELKWEPAVNAAQIGVEVKDGIVTLAGHVGSYAEKWDAESAAQRVSGVKGLAVEMDVKLAGASKRTDAEIATSASNVLQWMTYLSIDAVKVQVENGWITLSGELEWEYQRRAAGLAVRHLMGVTGLSNQIAIRAKVSTNAIKADIEAALKRRAHDDAQKFSVEVRGNEVTLSGKAHSWAERDLARQAAWSAHGVHKVVDNMSVGW